MFHLVAAGRPCSWREPGRGSVTREGEELRFCSSTCAGSTHNVRVALQASRPTSGQVTTAPPPGGVSSSRGGVRRMFAVNPRVHRVVDPHSGPFGHCEHMPLRTEPHTNGERGPTARVRQGTSESVVASLARSDASTARAPRLGTGRLSRKPRRPFTKNLSAHVDHRRLRLHTPDDLHRSLLHSEHLNVSLPRSGGDFRRAQRFGMRSVRKEPTTASPAP